MTEQLRRAMAKFVVDNKMRGAVGEADTETGRIRINKKAHKNKRIMKGFPEKDRTLINTLVHEKMHVDHPKMHEKTVRKNTRSKVERMSRKQKARYYAKLS